MATMTVIKMKSATPIYIPIIFSALDKLASTSTVPKNDSTIRSAKTKKPSGVLTASINLLVVEIWRGLAIGTALLHCFDRLRHASDFIDGFVIERLSGLPLNFRKDLLNQWLKMRRRQNLFLT
jgi:hypothetical protein